MSLQLGHRRDSQNASPEVRESVCVARCLPLAVRGDKYKHALLSGCLVPSGARSMQALEVSAIRGNHIAFIMQNVTRLCCN